VEREFRVMSALAGTDVPVAKTYALCQDAAVIGTTFYVMEYVEGRILWDPTLPGMSPAQRAAHYDALNRVIAALHRVDAAAAGLADYGRPGNYVERQVARWSKQYQAAAAPRIPAMDRLIEWLPRHVPEGEETSLVHGDYRIDNVIFHPTEPRVLAVLDWELSTLGHPLADFSYSLMMYRLPHGMSSGLGGLDLAALNIPSEADYVGAYCRRTGRDGIPDLDFYMAFNLFRLAGILHGIKGRYVRGNASSAHAAAMIEGLEPLAELAWAEAVKAGAG
jgi:aminoglycoside phosphotransferase (APT) family kinase protein